MRREEGKEREEEVLVEVQEVGRDLGLETERECVCLKHRCRLSLEV